MRAVVDAGRCVRSLQIDYDEEVEFAGQQKLYDLARFNKDNPWMMWVSFTHPHSPFITTDNYWNLYNHNDIDMPAVPSMTVEEMDVMSRCLFHAHGGDLHNITDEHIRNARHTYYGMCTYIDDKVSKLLDTLESLNLDENTVVVFTSDHGEMLGERGQWFKQSSHEWSVRVPLIISVSGCSARGHVRELVSLVDLMPTFADIASNGNSLLPLMQGSTD